MKRAWARVTRSRATAPALAVIYLAVVVNLYAPVALRTRSAALNMIVFIAAMLIPVGLVWMVLRLKRRWLAWTLAILLAPIALVSALLAMLAVMILPDAVRHGINPSFERLQSVRVAGAAVTTYRTNGGAMTSFGIALRREREILPGILLVRHLRRWYPAYEASVTVIGPRRVRVAIPPYTEDRPETADTTVVMLRPW